MNTIALLNLSKRLSLGSNEILQNVRLAVDNPSKYFHENRNRLDERNIDELTEELPWIALVDELIENGFAFEVDWKESNYRICEIIDVLLEKKSFSLLEWQWADEGNYDELSTAEFLHEVSQRLKAHSISLAYVDIDSDSYVLIVVPVQEIESLKMLALAAGHSISDIFI
ncbi:hypothetical protein ABD76_10715 [Paenibacillus dendritiformis]|uniref:DUF6630 family protein n=1 Tax=Paenibacillus dendritiformis TaxID=130049 RepID=UPI0018CDDD0D|nr:DUF6630 family protein [Paenibacillus dendritiformis]MBG9792935.1 hypothetical protein [Paenibacillus dendritiformis]